MTQKTTLFKQHLLSSAKMVNFHGWEMPIHYGSQIKEHEEVRNNCGVFDVSHMTFLDVIGEEAKHFLKILLSNDISVLRKNGDGIYSAMLNDSGGILDDLIAYKIPSGYRLVVNCATRESDLNWILTSSSGMEVDILERKDLVMLAIQGPHFEKVMKNFLQADVIKSLLEKRNFQGIIMDDTLISKTGYTGEKGIEIMMPEERGEEVWTLLINCGVKPIGLAARDTLRLEAGLNLYGFEMDKNTSPLECNMGWTVSLKDPKRNFIGKRSFLEKKRKGEFPTLHGLMLDDKVIIRSNHEVYLDTDRKTRGVVTSGSYSPSLKRGIALARIPPTNSRNCFVEVRGKEVIAKLGKPRFIQKGKNVFKEKI